MIKPTIGRVLLFHPAGSTAADQPVPVLVCHVWSDTCVNVAGFDANGNPIKNTSTFLYQGEGERPASNYAEWMPYQIGQAAKEQESEEETLG